MQTTRPIFALVASGAVLSEPVNLQGAKAAGLWIPTVDSAADLTVRAAYAATEPSSANFFPTQATPPNTGVMKVNVQAGQIFVPLGALGEEIAALQFQLGVATTTPRTFCLVAKI